MEKKINLRNQLYHGMQVIILSEEFIKLRSDNRLRIWKIANYLPDSDFNAIAKREYKFML